MDQAADVPGRVLQHPAVPLTVPNPPTPTLSTAPTTRFYDDADSVNSFPAVLRAAPTDDSVHVTSRPASARIVVMNRKMPQQRFLQKTILNTRGFGCRDHSLVCNCAYVRVKWSATLKYKFVC